MAALSVNFAGGAVAQPEREKRKKREKNEKDKEKIEVKKRDKKNGFRLTIAHSSRFI
jgi:hypothetical protein